jgi:hypothetical protein
MPKLSDVVLKSFVSLKIRYHREHLEVDQVQEEIHQILDGYQQEKRKETKYQAEDAESKFKVKYLTLIERLLHIKIPNHTDIALEQVFAGTLSAELKTQLEQNLFYPIDHLILHVMAEQFNTAVYLPKPTLSPEVMIERLDAKLNATRAQRMRAMFAAEKERILQMERQSLEQAVGQEALAVEIEQETAQVRQRAEDITHQESMQGIAEQRLHALTALEKEQAELQRRELNLHFTKELFEQHKEEELRKAGTRKPTNAERIIAEIKQLDERLEEINTNLAEKIEQQTAILQEEISAVNQRLQEMSQQNEAANAQLTQLHETLSRQVSTSDEGCQQKLTEMVARISQLAVEQQQTIKPLSVELSKTSIEVQKLQAEQSGSAKKLHDKLMHVQTMVATQSEYFQQMTQQYTKAFSQFSTQIEELQGDVKQVGIRLDGLLAVFNKSLSELSQQNQQAVAELGKTLRDLISIKQEEIKQAMSSFVASVRNAQQQNLQSSRQDFLRISEQLAALEQDLRQLSMARSTCPGFFQPQPIGREAQEAEASYTQGNAYYKMGNHAGARRCFESAMQKRHTKARTTYAVLYLIKPGTDLDKQRGYELLFQSAQQGHGRAQFNLAEMLAHGDGIKKDLPQAKYWYEQVAENAETEKGRQEAQAKVDEVTAEMEQRSARPRRQRCGVR